jgi:hypothetical protein
MKVAGKEVVKQLLGEVPFTAELYWLLRQRGKTAAKPVFAASPAGRASLS